MTPPLTRKPRGGEPAPALRPRPLAQSLLTHLAVAGTAALAASSAHAQVTVTQVNENVGFASYAYDTSGYMLPTGATMEPAPSPEPSPALALAVLSALTLGAVGVRRMKDLRA